MSMLNFLKNKKNEDNYINISNKNVFRLILIIALTYLSFLFVIKVSYAIELIVIAIFLSLTINAPVHRLSHLMPGRLKGNRTLGTTVSLVIVLLALSILIISIAPPLINQTSGFIKNSPNLVQDLHNQDSQLGGFIHKYHLDNQINTVSDQLSSRLKSVGSSTFSTITDVTSSIIAILTVFVLTFMMLIEGPKWLKFGYDLFEPAKSVRLKEVSAKMYDVIKGYVNGQVLMAAVAAVIIVIPLFILNVSYPIALMVIVFICALIPMVGHTIGLVIITSVSLFHSFIAALIVVAYYILYMQIEAYVIQPRIQSSKTNLSPLMVFAALLIGLSFDGLIGGLMAIPVAGCLKVLAEEYLKNHKTIKLSDTKY